VDATVLSKRPREATDDAVEAVYRRHHRELLRVATAITGSADLGADAVQEGLARALAKRSSFRGSGSLDGWLWKVVVNAARNLAARTPRSADPQALDDEAVVCAPNDEGAAVRERLAQLPERQRLVLFLRYYADLDYAAIARILRIRPGTVSATLNQAHAALRPLLAEEVHR
jgi:RNA polymerase sigma-70 factor (ECF subfamily)